MGERVDCTAQLTLWAEVEAGGGGAGRSTGRVMLLGSGRHKEPKERDKRGRPSILASFSLSIKTCSTLKTMCLPDSVILNIIIRMYSM